MRLAKTEHLPEVVHVGGEVFAEDENIINEDKTEGKTTQDEVHYALKGVPAFQRLKGILKIQKS